MQPWLPLEWPALHIMETPLSPAVTISLGLIVCGKCGIVHNMTLANQGNYLYIIIALRVLVAALFCLDLKEYVSETFSNWIHVHVNIYHKPRTRVSGVIEMFKVDVFLWLGQADRNMQNRVEHPVALSFHCHRQHQPINKCHGNRHMPPLKCACKSVNILMSVSIAVIKTVAGFITCWT